MRTSDKPRFLAVLDFEATCADERDSDWSIERQEIIELPIALVSVDERRHLDTFHTFIEPTEQSQLTAFCTELTSIRQDEVTGQPKIGDAMAAFDAWVLQHGLEPQSCCVVTCGDWDLKRMWPKQASLVPGLATPPLFRRWCNIKKVFAQATGNKAMGMMGMLEVAGLRHEGRHHRGLDDVLNLVRVVQWLLEQGVDVGWTWSDADRKTERARLDKKLSRRSRAREQQRAALASLPDAVAEGVRSGLRTELAALDSELEVLERHLHVFG